MARQSKKISKQTSLNEKEQASEPLVAQPEQSPLNTQLSQANNDMMVQIMQGINYRLAELEKRPVSSDASRLDNQNGYCSENSSRCCCFDIFISRVKVTESQFDLLSGNITEPGDGADVPFPAPLLSPFMELIFHVIADGEGAVYPNLMSPMQLSKKTGWSSVNKKIRQISVNGTKAVPIVVEAREVEQAFNIDGQAEYGSSSVNHLNLACGCPVVPIQIPVKLNAGGTTGGAVEVEVTARETCCDGCC